MLSPFYQIFNEKRIKFQSTQLNLKIASKIAYLYFQVESFQTEMYSSGLFFIFKFTNI